MTTFFVADTHIGSKNIINYCNRPFKAVEEMDEALINNWNSVATNNDTIYMLGDMIWGHQNYRRVLEKLNGKKHLILGNHDTEQVYKKIQIDGLIQGLHKQKNITIEGQYIHMCHFPMRSWNRSFHGAWHLYGHCHNTIPDFGLSTDVGVDHWNYFPVSFEQLKEYFGTIDKFHNEAIRDDYVSHDLLYHKYFIGKYKERIKEDANELEKLIEEEIDDDTIPDSYYDNIGEI